MTGYLDAALRRMALPISVRYIPLISGGYAFSTKRHDKASLFGMTQSPADATAAYLALCREMDPTAS